MNLIASSFSWMIKFKRCKKALAKKIDLAKAFSIGVLIPLAKARDY